MPDYEPPEPTRLGEVVWLEPYPDVLPEGAIDVPRGPDARFEQTESISLAFVTALQLLPPRQLAVLILRDVLGFHANEVADMLDSTVDSVNSALKRARLRACSASGRRWQRVLPPSSDSPSKDTIVAKFVRGYESADLDASVALFRPDDVFMSMPPMPFEYEGQDVVARFCASLIGSGRRFDLMRDVKPTASRLSCSRGLPEAPLLSAPVMELGLIVLSSTCRRGPTAARAGLLTHG